MSKRKKVRKVLCRNLPEVKSLKELMPVENWLFLEEAQKLMSVTKEQSVRLQVWHGRIRGRRLNGRLIVYKPDVLNYIRERYKGVYYKGGRPRKKRTAR